MNSCQKPKKLNVVSVIVPVFNEEKTVAGVVDVLLKNPLINEVICVNDGSTDKSLSVLKRFKNKIRLIDLKKNKGKGFALVAGIKEAKGEIITFIDADLVNLSDGHIKTLLDPILENKAKAVLGYPTKGWFLPNMFSQLTGERAYYKKDLIPCFGRMTKTRFGVEVFLNDVFDEKETKKVPLKRLRGLYKYEKHNSTTAFKEYLGEAVEIARELGRREGLLAEDRQIIAKLVKVADFQKLKSMVKEIKNKRVKQFLEKYVLKYARMAKKWWKDF